MAWLVLGFVVLQRVSELMIARRNTARILVGGGHEAAGGHYPLFFAVHGGWLAAMAAWIAAGAGVNALFLALYVLVLAFRAWVMLALGRRWTTRILVVPGEEPLRHGPYRFLRHPNYAVVAAEIALVPLIFSAWPIALAFSLLNLPLMWWRIRAEEEAWADAAR
ncbi:MAG: isoprenylcysteine carboxylmethyltransferase family protein [Alphaproteobacteria bacterium]